MSSKRFRQTRSWLAAIVVSALLPLPASGQFPAEPAADPFDLVFFGPDGAVFLRLNVGGSADVSTVRREFSASLLRQFDADGDGVLSADEAMQVPADGQGAGTAKLGENWGSLDVDPQDGVVSDDELFQFVNASLGPPFRVEIKSDLEQSVTVHAELDADGDGKVSQSEIEDGMAMLRRFDYDDDETLSIGELQPFPTTILQSQRQSGQSTESPILALATPEQRALARDRLLSLYGAAESHTVAPQLLGLRDADAGTYDTNQDQQIDAEELLALLESPVPSLALDCLLNRGIVGVDRRVRPGTLIGVRNIRTRKPELTFAGTDVTVSASSPNTAGISDTDIQIADFLTKFFQVDADDNDYLGPAEFAGIGIPRTEFEAVDADGDGMIMHAELKKYLQMWAALETQATLVVTVANEGTTLFEILETSSDFRLSPRELREGFERVREYDQNGDGALAPTELQDRYSLEVSAARPILFQNLFNNAMGQNQQRIEGIRQPQTSGPGWFRKMDRNQDGDLTWREFFGTREDFAEIDRDGDGLIDLNEAVAAE